MCDFVCCVRVLCVCLRLCCGPFKELETNFTHLDIKGNISVRIGDSNVAPTVYYEQYNVTLTNQFPNNVTSEDYWDI